jgi:NADPH:quinone reductase-like Zn-dependent oxidoreductase
VTRTGLFGYPFGCPIRLSSPGEEAGGEEAGGEEDVKALAISGYGPDAPHVVKIAEPRPGPGEVLVEMRAAALNHLDLWTLSGSLKVEHLFPHVLGADGAGVIAEVGEDVAGLAPGASVMINPGLSCHACEFCRAGEQSLCTSFRMLGEHVSGTLAQKVVVPASNVFPYPEHLSFAEAAALGVTAITAYRMLFSRGQLKAGEWVLVTGIGGGLALGLFQLARPVAGRLFVTSSSPAKLDRALLLGADAAINYKDEDVGVAVRRLTGKRGVDLVVDSAGGPGLDAALRALRKGGRLVVAGATAGAAAEVNLRRLFWNQLSVVGSTMGSTSEVSDMLRMVAGTKLKPIVDRTFSLEDGGRALSYLAEQEQFGKVVVEIAG